MVKHLLTTYTGHAVELLKECQPIFIRLSEIVDEAGYNAAFLLLLSEWPTGDEIRCIQHTFSPSPCI